MRKTSIVMTVLATFAVAGVASAQKGAGTGSGSAAGAGSGTGATKAEKKPAAPPAAKPADPAKGDTKTTTTTTTTTTTSATGSTDAAGMAAPKPDAQLVALTKTMKGTWTCTGDMMGPDGNPAYKTKATSKVKTDLDGLWIRTDYVETKSKAVKVPYKFTSYATYDAKNAKWYRVMVDNWGMYGSGWSTGADAAGAIVWDLTMKSPMGDSKFRDHDEPATDPKAKKGSRHMWGEMSMDNGKTYTKVYDVTCKK